MPTLTVALLKELLHYCPSTGVFTWRVNRGGTACSGRQAGSIQPSGYVQISVCNKVHRAHRLAYLYMTEEFPRHEIDHLNGMKSDNRWSNLTQATRGDNCKNLSLPKVNTSGVIGVHLNKRSGKWVAQIRTDNKRIHLGSFTTKEEASRVRKAAEKRYGFHPNHGKKPRMCIVKEGT